MSAWVRVRVSECMHECKYEFTCANNPDTHLIWHVPVSDETVYPKHELRRFRTPTLIFWHCKHRIVHISSCLKVMPQQTAKNGFPFLSWQSEKSKSSLFAPTIQLLSSHTNKDDDCEYHTCSNSWKLSSSHHTWPQNSSAQNKTSFLCILKPLVMNQSYKWYVLTRCLAPNHNYITWNRQTNHIDRTVPKHVILGLFVWFLPNSTVPVMTWKFSFKNTRSFKNKNRVTTLRNFYVGVWYVVNFYRYHPPLRNRP